MTVTKQVKRNRVTTRSTNLRQVWLTTDNTLIVEFKNGQRAAYENVPESKYEALIGSDSVGRYYNRYIKGKFTGVSSDIKLTYAYVPPVVDSLPTDVYTVTYVVPTKFTTTVKAKSLAEAVASVKLKGGAEIISVEKG